MAISVLNRPPRQSSDVTASRLLVTRQDDTRLYRPIGFLCCDHGEYTFQYLKKFVESEWFSPLPGLSDVRKRYSSTQLFPIFAERVISARRPDRTESLRALGLPSDAAPFEVLTRTGGRRVGDTIELVPMPVVGEGGSFSQLFLVHGVRYRTDEAQSRISGLRPGEALRLTPEPANLVNSLAVQVEDLEGLTLGFVPDPLAEFIQGVLADPRGHSLTVEQANGPEVGFHFRLLVRLEGYSQPGTEPYTGSGWEFYS
jgi:hypothetical protein